MNFTKLERRLRIFETDYGRQVGWFMEHHGRRVAELTEPRCEDMFWDSYRIDLLTDDPAEREARDFEWRESNQARFGIPS